MEGIFHEYYTVALAPAIGALVGLGAAVAWSRRREHAVRLAAAASVGLSAWWAIVLLAESPTWNPWLTPALAVGAAVTAAVVLYATRARLLQAAALTASLVVLLATPALASLATAQEPHTGAIPTAVPTAVAGADGRGAVGGPNGAFRQGGLPGQDGTGFRDGNAFPGQDGIARPVFPPNGIGRGAPGQGGLGGQNGAGGRGPGGAGGLGGLLDAQATAPALVAALQEDADHYRWTAATTGSNNAAGLALSSGTSVMSIGGFNGTDPSPTLAQFQAYVAEGAIHYYVGGNDAGGFRGAQGGSQVAAEIDAWVAEQFEATQIGGIMVYDLSGGATDADPTDGSVSA
jgi:hypothetical protein